MDSQTLFQQGVTAIREQNDVQRGRELLIQSLRQDAHNDMAWLWLTRTVRSREKQLEYVERALQINPANDAAQKLKTRLLASTPAAPPAPAAAPASPVIAPLDRHPAAPPAPAGESASAVIVPLGEHPPAPVSPFNTVAVPVTPEEQDEIARLMERAEIYVEAGEIEAAVEQWVAVLNIRVDHETALRNASGHLWRLQFRDDAQELVQRAIDAGTTVPSIYLTAIDIAERLGEARRAEELREQVAALPGADDQLLAAIADDYLQRFRTDEALTFLKQALESHPDSQKLLIKTGDLLKELERPQEAMPYYDRAVRAGARTKEGKKADQRLLTYVPVLTDRERGNVWLAVREAAGIALFYFVMAWQDAGLYLLQMGPQRWLGVGLGMVGGYMLVTATSSPQQDPVAGWLGGEVPAAVADVNTPHATPGRALEEPTHLPIISDDMRYVLGTVGIVLLIMALLLVFHRTLDLMVNDPPPYLPWSGN
jgi:tetratricopeptide (TPR) repeat protein